VETIDIRTDETFVHGDVAYTIGDYEETLTMTPDAEPMSVHNHWFARWERGADGTWRIDRMVVGTVEAPEEM
jgi:ketosteroid isomerase-like protein